MVMGGRISSHCEYIILANYDLGVSGNVFYNSERLGECDLWRTSYKPDERDVERPNDVAIHWMT